MRRPRPRTTLKALRDEPVRRMALRGRLAHPWRRHRFHAFGTGSFIDRPLGIYTPWQMAIGDNVMVLPGAWLSVERPAWDRPAPVLQIGDHVGLRPHCTVSAAESVVIESHVIIAAYSTVIDCNHTQVPGIDNVLWTPMRTAPVRIGKGTWIGERCSILAGADIGEHCIIGANSVVTGPIPDWSVAVGAPARVVGSSSSSPR